MSKNPYFAAIKKTVFPLSSNASMSILEFRISILMASYLLYLAA